MSFAVLTILLPALAACCLLGLGTPRQGAAANLSLSLLEFGGTLAAVTAPGVALVHADSIGLIFGVLTGFINLTTAAANVTFVRRHADRMSARRWRAYHAMCQLSLAAILLGLYADNVLLIPLAAELAVIAGAVAISLPGTPDALAAARRYFFAAATSLALTTFGTLLLYAAAQAASSFSLDALSLLSLASNHFNAPLPGFVFLLAGYGGLTAHFPLHAWRTASPTPLTTSLAALTPNLALLAILRFSHLTQGQAAPFLLCAGLGGLAIAVMRLVAAKDPITSFAAFGIGASALAVFAFGIGTPAAIFGALLVMILAPLISTAGFQTLLAETSSPWLIAIALFAGSALPPSGLFAGIFIIGGQTIQHRPWLAAPVILMFLLMATALLRRIPRAISGRPGRGAFSPALHLLLVLAIAFAMPPALVHILSTAAVGPP